MIALNEMSGKIFGRLTAIHRVKNRNGSAMFLCKCICGNEKIVGAGSLRHGKTISCGCYKKEFYETLRTHGMTRTPIYKIWRGMIRRCENPQHKHYKEYGGRGVKVCSRWHIFENWYADLGERPSPKHTLERIDNNGDYEPGNCKWATRKEQQNNTRRNHLIEFNGEIKNLKQWSEILGINYTTLKMRICQYKWPIAKALTTRTKVRRMEGRES